MDAQSTSTLRQACNARMVLDLIGTSKANVTASAMLMVQQLVID